MKLLVLGGTLFLGRHIVEAALARGDEVTIFTRGQHNPDLFPEVEHLRGDRDGGLAPLRGRRWDAVIDTSGYVPRIVGAAATLLADAVERYLFISSISVYAAFDRPAMDESAALGTLADPTVETIDGATYGPLKALSERAVQEALPDRAIVLRPGLIVGPHDPTDRFTYWPWRVARDGDVLVPRSLDWPVQLIDARDLADFALLLAAGGAAETYNVTGPHAALTIGNIFTTCREVAGSAATPVVVDEAFLTGAGVRPWMGPDSLPLWLPDSPETFGFATVNCRKAIAAGLTFRPLRDTVRDTLDWDRARPADSERKAGLSREREADLLRQWRDRQAVSQRSEGLGD